MEVVGILIVALLVGLAFVLTAVALRRRGRRARVGNVEQVDLESVPSETPSAGGSIEGRGLDGPIEGLSYRVSDPSAPWRELLVEFVPSGIAELAETKGVSRIDETHTGANAFDSLISSVPKAAALIESGMTMRVIGPPEALAGLKSGALELVTSGGKSLGQVRDVASGQFGSHLAVAAQGVTPAMGALAVFQAMSVVTGQYYMHRIDEALSQVQQGIDGLVRGQQSELLGKVQAAARLNERVRRNLLDGIIPNEGDRDDLNHAEQMGLAAYGEAQGRVSDLFAAVDRFDIESAKRGDLRKMWSRGETEGITDANILIFAAFTRHQNNLLALAVESEGDSRRAENIYERIEEERDSMIADLERIRWIFEKLGSLERNDFERFRFGADKLAGEANAFRNRVEPIREVVDRPGAQALPPPPPLDVPFLAEVSGGADGERRVVGAVLRRKEGH